MARITPDMIRRLAAMLEPAMRRAFINAAYAQRGSVVLRDLQSAIAVGDIAAILGALNITADHFTPVRRELRKAFSAGGALAVGTIPVGQTSPDGSRTNIVFTGERLNEAAIIRGIEDLLIQGITDDTEEMVREVLANATLRSQNPNNTAIDLVGRINTNTGRREGGLLGLTAKDARTVRSVQQGVLDVNVERLRSYLQLTSRNKRYDGAVKRIIAGTEKPTITLANNITDGLSNKLLRTRGQAIARTNTLGAYGEGLDAGYQRIIDEGIVDPETISKEWSTSGDGRVRGDHSSVNGTSVPFDEPYIVNGFPMMRPRDGSLGAPPDQTINCRCVSIVRFDYLKFERV